MSKLGAAAIAAITVGITFETSALRAQSLHVTTNRVFATDVTAETPVLHITGTTAAVVNDHVIAMKDVIAACLREDRSNVVDQMVQDYVVDRECARQGIVVSDADIDQEIDALRKNLAPLTLEQEIAKHHSSMAYVRNAFKEKVERVRLVQDQVQPIKIVHCRAIVIKYTSPGEPESVAGTTRSEGDAKALIQAIRDKLAQGKDFGDLADQYSAATPKNDKGDIGMVYSGVANTDPKIVEVALGLVKGETYGASFQINNAYWLIQAVSTSDDHMEEEDAGYKASFNTYREQQSQFLYPQVVVGLIDKSTRTYVLDPDAIVQSGKPLPEAAAVIDGHNIPMKDVVEQCLQDDGPATVDTMVQNYLVDQECKRQKITITDAQIDRLVQNLASQIKPHTLDEGLKFRHITMDRLRFDFKQQLEREALVADQVPPTKIVHCRVITIKYVTRTEADALALIKKIQDQLKQGKDFAGLAAQYSENTPETNDGDVGMLWQGINNVETPLVDAGLGLDSGGVTTSPVKLLNAYCLVQVISTSSDHSEGENSAYTAALTSYKAQHTPMLESAEIIKLIKKSKVVYYIHA